MRNGNKLHIKGLPVLHDALAIFHSKQICKRTAAIIALRKQGMMARSLANCYSMHMDVLLHITASKMMQNLKTHCCCAHCTGMFLCHCVLVLMPMLFGQDGQVDSAMEINLAIGSGQLRAIY